MDRFIHVIGIGADGLAGLRPGQLDRIHAADFLAGGERHLAFFPNAEGERFVIRNNIEALGRELRQRHPAQRCVVLASGDPLFFGVAGPLVAQLGPERVRVEPALSSMQLAFARACLPWQAAALASVHGRPLAPTLLPLLGKLLIGLFTQDGDGPAAVARFLLERDADCYEGWVGEDLGSADERVSGWLSLTELKERRFAPLNYLILCDVGFLLRRPRLRPEFPRGEVLRLRDLVPGVPDEAFARPADGPEVMTRQEVRAVAVAKLLGGAFAGNTAWDVGGNTAWDVGAGLGTVSVELAVLRPELEVIAVERDPARAALLRQNRGRFRAYNIRVIVGEAPDALAGAAEPPRYVFLGGSGGRLEAVLDLVARRLIDGGRLVAAFVTLEHLALTLERLRTWGWPVEVTEVAVSRSDALAGLTGLKPQRGVFLVRADKPPADVPRAGGHTDVG
ncbi:MAG TPA: precorrin-6y C5,15-methyltransferase (decarboxylating) subunit CbiE [Gemmataceae bacterium]|nr:precorrin-6y C5,15-methyltransferase (decarboxylating) subunit CbiE [Gemmataceae bacterium]